MNFARLRVPGSQRHIPTPKVLKYHPPGSIKRTRLGVLVYLQEPMMGSWYHQNRCHNRDFSYPDRILVGIRDFQAKSGES